MSGAASLEIDSADLWSRYLAVRTLSERLTENLSAEDQTVQSMPDASPAKWHLAHTSWFFETFILAEYLPDYSPFDECYRTLFNSYYNQVGDQYSRPRRGLITRPNASEILNYRRHVDEQIYCLLNEVSAPNREKVLGFVELGLNHEQQHQELILTDIKHAFSLNPTLPAFCRWQENAADTDGLNVHGLDWESFDAGIYQIGHEGDAFHFDNESPRHRVFQESYNIARRPATNAEYIEFIEDGGYKSPALWLSEGWTWVNENNVTQPLYWSLNTENWATFTLGGLKPLALAEPVIHISYFEADAFARWAGFRLPTEQEWEVAASESNIDAVFLNPERCHPAAAKNEYFGSAWCWTSSAYDAYPGFKVAEGAVGEYNGKFMCNQYVLRGGSCVTPTGHIRPSYRNFFPAHTRWQFSGVRFAKDA